MASQPSETTVRPDQDAAADGARTWRIATDRSCAGVKARKMGSTT